MHFSYFTEPFYEYVEPNHYGNCWSDNERNRWLLDLSYFPFYSSGTNPSSFHGRGFGRFLNLPSFIMVVRLPQNHYTRTANQWNQRNAADGRNRNWGPWYRIFNHILRRSYFALPWETFAVAAVISFARMERKKVSTGI